MYSVLSNENRLTKVNQIEFVNDRDLRKYKFFKEKLGDEKVKNEFVGAHIA